MLKKLLAGLITAVLSLGAVALIAGPASAHHNTITVSVACATSGAYTVTWKVKNSETDKTEVITASNLPAVVPVNTSFAFGETKTFVQTVTTPQDIELALTGYWAATKVTNYDKGSIAKESFPTGCLKVTAEATSTPSVCDGPNTFTVPEYTLKAVTGVQYTVDGTLKAAGTYDATNGTTVHIVASVTDPKYEIVGTKVWDLTFNKPADTCVVKVVPVKPGFAQQVCDGPGSHKLATYTITAVTGVLYYVKIDGGAEQPTTAGVHNIPDGVTTIQVIAKGDANNFYVIEGGPKVYDVETLNPAGTCLIELKPLDPDPKDSLCTVANPGVVPPTTFTLIYVEHVIYQVSINGAPATDEIIAANKTITVPAGSTVVVTARADDPAKYQTKAFSWTKVFVNPGDCKVVVTPLKPAATDQFCDKFDPNNPKQVQGIITIPATADIAYFIDGSPATAGPNVVTPGVHQVTASVINAATHKLDAGVVLPFKFDIKPGLCQPDFLSVPAAASSQIGCFSGGSYTLSNSLNDPNAVIWTVNGTQVASGKYTVTNSGTVTIVASPNLPRYGFTPGSQTTWTVNYQKPTVCDLETLALTGQSPTGLLIVADLLVVAGLALFAVRAMRRGRLQMD